MTTSETGCGFPCWTGQQTASFLPRRRCAALKISAKMADRWPGMPKLIGDEMEAVLAQSTGFFRERPAAAGLAGVFSAVWVHRMEERDVAPIVITPDATIDLQWI